MNAPLAHVRRTQRAVFRGYARMLDFFLKHPRSVGETYIEHMAAALSFGVAMIVAGLACVVHAFLPAFFERTGSRAIAELYGRMVINRRRKPGSYELDYAI
jgi:hypothetical protein